jgi:molybdopterin-guanine dinucleotide biosynthesis protein A
VTKNEIALPERVLGGVLVGGVSSRMGAPKGALAWRGRTLLEVAVSALEPAVQEVVLLGDPPPPIRGIAAGAALRCLPDARESAGPLAGVLAALRAEPDAVWIVAACDQPWATPAAARWLLAQRDSGVHVVLPRASGGRVEPMPALFAPGALALVEAMAARGERAPRTLAGRPHVVTPEIPGAIRRAWMSVNTPEEYDRLRAEP